jgi:hypothetical protein
MSEEEQQSAAYERPQTSGLAVASLVASILGLIQVLPLVGCVVGIVLGYIARNQIRESGGLIGGEGLATGGIIVGWIGVALVLIGICLFVLFWAGLISLSLPFGLCEWYGTTVSF